MIIKKKQIVTATLAMALGAAVFVNWYYTRPEPLSTLNDGETTTASDEKLGEAQYVSATTAQSSEKTFADFKLKRDASYDEVKDSLNTIIKDSKSEQSAVAKATDELTQITARRKDETDLENLITAKINSECLVIIDSDVCQVVVSNGVASENVSLQIKELVVTRTKIPSKNITIIELKG